MSLVGAVRRRAARAARGRRLVRHLEDAAVRVGTATGDGVVGSFPLEDYVTGALAGEAPADWPDEFLGALAIAVRGYAIGRIITPRSQAFDVLASSQDQAFVIPRLADDRVRRAVERTSHTYLLSEGAAGWLALPHQALFHTSCGGQTDSVRSVWGPRPDPAAVAACEPCQVDAVRWSARLGEVRPVEILERAPGGHIRRVRIADRVLTGEAFRAEHGFTTVQSTRFEVRVDGSTVVLDGTGAGHGVGLCKHGARAMADDGRSAEQILQHYYPGCRLSS